MSHRCFRFQVFFKADQDRDLKENKDMIENQFGSQHRLPFPVTNRPIRYGGRPSLHFKDERDFGPTDMIGDDKAVIRHLGLRRQISGHQCHQGTSTDDFRR
jgi:hypothetical protein